MLNASASPAFFPFTALPIRRASYSSPFTLAFFAFLGKAGFLLSFNNPGGASA